MLSINRAATQLFEVKREECVGHDIITVSRNEALIAVIEAVFRERVRKRRPRSERAYHIFGNPVFDGSGKVTGAVIFVLDVTEKQRAEIQTRRGGRKSSGRGCRYICGGIGGQGAAFNSGKERASYRRGFG